MADLEEKVKELNHRQDKIEVKIAVMGEDIKHIKSRIDDGLSQTITKVYDEVIKIAPSVKDNSFWIGKIKWGIFWIFIVGLCGGIITGVLKLIQ